MEDIFKWRMVLARAFLLGCSGNSIGETIYIGQGVHSQQRHEEGQVQRSAQKSPAEGSEGSSLMGSAWL